MLFGKLHSWEVGTWENALVKLPLGKKSYGKFFNNTLIRLKNKIKITIHKPLLIKDVYSKNENMKKPRLSTKNKKKAWGLVNYLPTDTYLTYPSDFEGVPFITLKGHSCTLKTGVLSEMNLNSLKSRRLGKIYIEQKKGKIYWAKVVPSI